jgi:hypothetical protein
MASKADKLTLCSRRKSRPCCFYNLIILCSKVSILGHAVNYIQALQNLLDENPVGGEEITPSSATLTSSSSFVTFSRGEDCLSPPAYSPHHPPHPPPAHPHHVVNVSRSEFVHHSPSLSYPPPLTPLSPNTTGYYTTSSQQPPGYTCNAVPSYR